MAGLVFIPGTTFVRSAVGITTKQTEIDFGSTGVTEKSFTVTDVDVSPDSHITGNIAYEAPTGLEQDDVEMDVINLIFAPGSGSFTIYAVSLTGLIAGNLKVNYTIGGGS